MSPAIGSSFGIVAYMAIFALTGIAFLFANLLVGWFLLRRLVPGRSDVDGPRARVPGLACADIEVHGRGVLRREPRGRHRGEGRDRFHVSMTVFADVDAIARVLRAERPERTMVVVPARKAVLSGTSDPS